MLDRLSHFELLSITPETDARGIREAFYCKASTPPPNIYRLALSPEDHERLTTVYARRTAWPSRGPVRPTPPLYSNTGPG